MKRQVPWTLLAMAVAACGGSMNPYGTTGGATSANPTPSATPTPSASPNPSATTSSSPSNVTPAGFVITIQNMGFTPLNMAVPAGATVSVVNRDGMPHSVTSEPSPGSYTRGAPGGLAPFDTGAFSSGQKTITIPANATPGTVIPYYCTVHTRTMTTPNGTITIDPNAKPASATTMTTTAPTSSTTTSMPAPPPAPSGGGY